jgi:hypothetical protein
MFPDFGAGRPVVASPMTWIPGCFTDSKVTWFTSHQRLPASARPAWMAIAPARWGGIRFSTSYRTRSPTVGTTSRAARSTRSIPLVGR